MVKVRCFAHCIFCHSPSLSVKDVPCRMVWCMRGATLEGVWKASLSLSHCLVGQAAEHQTTHRRIDQGLAICREIFIILARATIPPQPSERSLYRPSPP